MSEEIHRKIVAWTSAEFARTEGRACIQLDLLVGPPGQRGTELRSWSREEQPELFGSLSAVEALASEILKVSEDYAESSGGGAHRCEIVAKQHLGKRTRMYFRVEAQSDGADEVDRMTPTAAGLISQLMRHNEFKEKTIAIMHQSAVGTLSRMVHDLADENRAMRKERSQHLDEVEAARSRQNERDIELAPQMGAEERKNQTFGKLMQLMPVVANRLLGSGDAAKAELKTGQASGIALIADELRKSLTQEQIMKLASVLGTNQMVLVGELMRTAEIALAEQGEAAAPQAGQAPADPGKKAAG